MKRPLTPPSPDRPQGIGASLARKEDDRFLHGRGEYVGNIRMVGMLDVAFVRSPIAHGHIVMREEDFKFPGFHHIALCYFAFVRVAIVDDRSRRRQPAR